MRKPKGKGYNEKQCALWLAVWEDTYRTAPNLLDRKRVARMYREAMQFSRANETRRKRRRAKT